MLKPILLTLIIIASLALFARNAYRLFKLVMQGQPENRFGNWDKRLLNVFEQVFLHKRLLNRFDIGFAHVLFFYGFLVIQVCALEIFAKGYMPHFTYAILGPLYPFLMFAQDIMCAGVLAAIAYSSYRRLVIQPKHLMTTQDGWRILGLIFGVVGTIYLLGATEILLGERDDVKLYMPFESMLAYALSGLPESALHGIKEFSWWAHVLIVLFFLNYLPSSKHLHLLGAIPNIFFAKVERHGALSTPNYEAEDIEIFGCSEPKHFTWKHLLDTTACTECGRCTSVCPAQFTGKPLSPMKIVHDLKLAMFDTKKEIIGIPDDPGQRSFIQKVDASLDNFMTDFGSFMRGGKEAPAEDHGHDGHGDAHGNGHGDHGHGNGHGHAAHAVAAPGEKLELIGGRTSLDELWSCTTCGGCVSVCPVLIEHVDDIVDMRRNLVLMQSNFPEELQRTFTALENEGNPWGVSAGSRADWVGDQDIKVLDDGDEAEILYWVGCAGAVDSRAKKVTQAMVKIMKNAGVDFGILGPRETCTGDPARRAGNEYLYQTLAKMNIETLNGSKFKKIVTQCPHCFNTLGKEYPDLGGNYEVVHHSEYINELIQKGKIKPETKLPDDELITFHDPCYLGRWNDVLEEPREAIAAVPGAKLTEMERSRKTSFCCGAGGARMWLEEHIGTPVNKERSREAVETGATTVAVGCPFCNTMITDGVKDLGKESTVKVMDLAEIVADSLK